MKGVNQLPVSFIREGFNVLKVLPSYKMSQTWTRPISVNFLITTRCNSKCVTCDSWKLEDHERELTTEEFDRLADEIADLRIPIVTIGGGEPTLRKDLWEIIKQFKKRGLTVQLTTNGLTLRDTQRRQLYESGTDRVTLSVDSHFPDLYDRIRGVDGYAAVEKNLKELLQDRPSHLEVDTNTVLCSDNAETFLDTIDHLISIGVPKVNFSAVTTSGVNYLMTSPKDDLSKISANQIHEIVAGLLERKKKTSAISASRAFIEGLARYYADPTKIVYPCYAGYLTFDIFQDGSIHGCGNLPAYGNVRQGSLRDIWFSDAAGESRRNMAEGKCPNCYLSCKIELAIAGDPKQLPRFAFDKVLSK